MTSGSERSATARLFARQRFGIAPGLQRTKRLLERLGRPQDAFDVVLVAGTNGKGGTVAHLDAMARADPGRGTIGRTTSPHLVDPGERIVVGGAPMAPDRFEALAADVEADADALSATFFETVTAMALLAFARAGVECALVEVGLGGRLDASNVLDPVVCGVSDIGLDHQAILGNDLAAIAREKAGILRRGVPAWSSADGVAAETLAGEAKRIGASLRLLGVDARVERRDRGWAGSDLVVTPTEGTVVALHTPLIGAAQARNAALAALLARELGITDEAIVAGAHATEWPGRLEVLRATPTSPAEMANANGRLLLDGAHNPAAARALAEALGALGCRPHLVVGLSEDKDATAVLSELTPVCRSVRTTRAASSPRAAAPAILATVVERAGGTVTGVHPDAAAAVRAALADAGGDEARHGEPVDVLVAGSLYLVGEVRAWARGATLPPWARWQ